MRLDKTLPYDSVHGVEGAAFQQAGRLFNQGGQLVVNGVAVVNEDDLLEELMEEAVQREIDEREAAGEDVPLEQRDWESLKALVEVYGGECTTKEAAVEFLRRAQR